MTGGNAFVVRAFSLTSWLMPLLVTAVLAGTECYAADPGSRELAFVKSLELFDAAQSPEDYRAAARELETILADGFENGAIYYNLGNAYYRAGDYGRAILSYRKAKPYRPRDTYLEANLQQALAAAPGRIEATATPWWTHVLFWSEWFSHPTKVQLAGIGIILSSTLLLLRVILRRDALLLAAVALLLTGSALAIDAWLSAPSRTQRAVIVAETVARKGTGKDYEAAFDRPLKDGAEFTILSETADWTFGHFEGIGEGWVRNECVAK